MQPAQVQPNFCSATVALSHHSSTFACFLSNVEEICLFLSIPMMLRNRVFSRSKFIAHQTTCITRDSSMQTSQCGLLGWTCQCRPSMATFRCHSFLLVLGASLQSFASGLLFSTDDMVVSVPKHNTKCHPEPCTSFRFSGCS